MAKTKHPKEKPATTTSMPSAPMRPQAEGGTGNHTEARTRDEIHERREPQEETRARPAESRERRASMRDKQRNQRRS